MKIASTKASTISKSGLDRLQRLADMSNIAFDGVDNFVEVAGENHLSHGQRESDGLRLIGVRRYRKSIWISDDIDQRGPGMLPAPS